MLRADGDLTEIKEAKTVIYVNSGNTFEKLRGIIWLIGRHLRDIAIRYFLHRPKYSFYQNRGGNKL